MRIKTALILCAGLGKRLAPLTLKTPKPLLELNNKTILEICINTSQKLGVEKIFLNTFHLGEKISDFIKSQNFPIDIEIVDDGEPVVENTVEAIVSGGTPPTDGQGGVGQNVYIYEGEVGYVATAGYGGGSYWYWDHVGTWKLR